MTKTKDDYIPDRDDFVENVVPDLPLPAIADDVCEYLSISHDELEQLRDEFESGLQNEDIMAQWERINPDPTDPEDMAKVYEESEWGYIIEQSFYERSSYGKYLRCRDHTVGNTLLDYGTALGSTALYFRLLDDMNVTAADLDSPHLELAKYRFQKHAPDIEVIEIDATNPPLGQWNTIVSIDVLEHIPNWKEVMDAFSNSQEKGDRYILKIGFGHPDDESLHITDENNLTPDTFRDYSNQLGYEIVYEEADKFFVGEKTT